MSGRHVFTWAIAIGFGFALASQAHAQNIILQFGSADGATSIQYPATVPNKAQPEAAIHAITGFDRTFGFGSSSTNTRT